MSGLIKAEYERQPVRYTSCILSGAASMSLDGRHLTSLDGLQRSLLPCLD